MSQSKSPSNRRPSCVNAVTAIKNSFNMKGESSGKLYCRQCNTNFSIPGFTDSIISKINCNKDRVWMVCSICSQNYILYPCDVSVKCDENGSENKLDVRLHDEKIEEKIDLISATLDTINRELAAIKSCNYNLKNIEYGRSDMPSDGFIPIKLRESNSLFANSTNRVTYACPSENRDNHEDNTNNYNLAFDKGTTKKILPKDNLSIRIDGLPEAGSEAGYWGRNECDRAAIQKILKFLEVDCAVENIMRIGKPDLSRNRRIIFQVNDSYYFKKIISTAKKLKQFETQGIYVNRHLSGDEAKLEKSILRHRWKLIHEEKIPRQEIRYTHGQLFVKGILQIIDIPASSDSYNRSNMVHSNNNQNNSNGHPANSSINGSVKSGEVELNASSINSHRDNATSSQ